MTFLDHWLLTILLLVPTVGGLAMPFVRTATAVRRTTLGLTIAAFCISLLVLVLFHRQGGPYRYAPGGFVQMSSGVQIISAIHWHYRVAIDGLSLPFVVTTTLIGVLASLACRSRVEWQASSSMMLLGMEATTLGVFLSFDLLLLCVFFAVSLVPCWGLIDLDSAEDKGRTIAIFLAEMLAGTACLFVATLGERLISTRWVPGGTFDLVALAARPTGERVLFLLMLIGFLVRIPVFGTQFWFASVGRQSSPVTLLAVIGLIPLTGVYGLLRVVVPLFPTLANLLLWVPGALGALTILYCSLCAVGHDDLRASAIYECLAMNGFALVAVACLTPIALHAAGLILIGQSLIAPSLIALASAVMSGTERGDPWRWLIGCLSAAWLAELVLPGLLGQTLMLLGIWPSSQGIPSPPRSGSLLFAMNVVAILGVVLTGIAGVRVLRRTAQTGGVSRAGQHLRVTALISSAAVLLAIFLVPFCFFYFGDVVAAILGRAP